MRRAVLAMFFLALSFVQIETAGGSMPCIHVENTFRFTLPLNLRDASFYFGPEGERCWAGPTWDPRILHPQPGRDTQGMVFLQRSGSRDSVWVSTLLDRDAGRMQYVAFTPEKAVSVIDVRLRVIGVNETEAEVSYARTALRAEANAEVDRMGKADAASGPEWKAAIERCLKAGKTG